MMKIALLLVAVAATAAPVQGWSWGHQWDKNCKTVAEVAVANNFTILVAALDAANLTETFTDKSLSVTVFAPTDEAFEAAFTALNVTAEDVLADTALLTAVLTTHVVDAVLGLDSWEFHSLNANQSLVISPTVSANNTARISTPGVRACRSVVYPIDTVLLPGM